MTRLPRITGREVVSAVDMTSAVTYHDEAGTGRDGASLGPAPDFVDAGVIASGAMGLSRVSIDHLVAN